MLNYVRNHNTTEIVITKYEYLKDCWVEEKMVEKVYNYLYDLFLDWDVRHVSLLWTIRVNSKSPFSHLYVSALQIILFFSKIKNII